MDLSNKGQPSGSSTPPLCSSPSTTPESTQNHTSELSSQSIQPVERSSSIRFPENIAAGKGTQMPDRQQAQVIDADEITPIRHADGHTERSYNTTEHAVNTGTSSAKPQTASNAEQETEQKQTWLKRIAEKFGSVSLENKGSVARDHLALERTFLAWLRTSLAFASIGIAVTQLFRLNTSIQTRNPNSTPSTVQSQFLPLSPLLGHGLPPELIPFLQQLASSTQQSLPNTESRNTLLDQLLQVHLTESNQKSLFGELEFDEHAAMKLRRVGKPLGATFIGISIIVLLVGFHRYFESQFWIIRGKFPASRGSVAFVGFIAGALIVASLIIVLVVAPVSYQKR